MKHLSLIVSALAVLGLTACEKGLEDETAVSPTGQVGNSVLQVRTRSGGSGSEATVAYPVTVYVFAGEECRAVQTIGDEGQTLNIAPMLAPKIGPVPAMFRNSIMKIFQLGSTI